MVMWAVQESARKATKAAEAEARRQAARQAASEQEQDHRQRLSEKLAKARPRLVSNTSGKQGFCNLDCLAVWQPMA